jgi:tetratricopeptide (TPR) repeat protein
LKNPVGQEPEKKKKKGLFDRLDRLRGRDDDDDEKVGDYRVPRSAREAALFARKAADQAVRLEPQSDAAQLAMGFALVVNDNQGRNRQDALTAFGRAVAAGPQEAENYYGLGYGIRNFAVKQNEGRGRDAEINRAIGNVKQAIELRPDFYEAHRELGLCYYLLDNTEAATAEYELANSYRGEATDRDEYASNDVALASLHQARAVKSGNNDERYRLASQGYMEDAQETSPDLKAAVAILGGAGLSTRITDFLPEKFKRILGLPDKVEGKINDKIRDKLPGGIRFP